MKWSEIMDKLDRYTPQQLQHAKNDLSRFGNLSYGQRVLLEANIDRRIKICRAYEYVM